MRVGRKEQCVVCAGSGLVDEQRNPVVYLSSTMPRGRVSLCTECKARGSVLYVWHVGEASRCIPLAKLARSPAHHRGLSQG